MGGGGPPFRRAPRLVRRPQSLLSDRDPLQRGGPRPPLQRAIRASRRNDAMKNMPIYEALAQAFAAEGVTAHFTLMGDGNMHWATAMKNLDGVDTFAARHEH